MSTLDTLQALFAADLQELRRIQKQRWHILYMTRLMKEEHLGRCCYLAEEFLGTTDLCTLKCLLDLDEKQWRSYKAKVSAQ